MGDEVCHLGSGGLLVKGKAPQVQAEQGQGAILPMATLQTISNSTVANGTLYTDAGGWMVTTVSRVRWPLRGSTRGPHCREGLMHAPAPHAPGPPWVDPLMS